MSRVSLMSAEWRRGLTWHCGTTFLTPYRRHLEMEQFEETVSIKSKAPFSSKKKKKKKKAKYLKSLNMTRCALMGDIGNCNSCLCLLCVHGCECVAVCVCLFD
ncbi:unnamed protein product [Lota lota]